MILIIGASSFIGEYIFNCCIKKNVGCIGTYAHTCKKGFYSFNLLRDTLSEWLEKNALRQKIETIIICSANASIDNCKINEKESFLINVLKTRNLVKDADSMGIKVIFLSSEAVFDGKRGMYKESDIPNPLTLYGKQKFELENFIQQNIKSYLIFRISRAVSCISEGKDIFKEFKEKVKNEEEIACIKGQSFSLTDVRDIAECIIEAERLQLDRQIYHISNNSFISRMELAKIYTDKFYGGYDKIVEKELSEFKFADSRHILGGLDGSKLNKLTKTKMKTIEDIFNEYEENRLYEI